MSEQLDLAYFAGIVDGEGSVSIACRKPGTRELHTRFNPRLQIANTDRRLIDWIRVRFGGTLIRTAATPTRQELLALCWRGQTAIALLQKVSPYLVIKAERAELVITAWSRIPEYIGHKHPLPEGIWEERNLAYVRLRAMNAASSRKVGTQAPLAQRRRAVI